MKHYVYKFTNMINGKFYIGKHSTNNLEDGYPGSGKWMKRAVKKYGIQNFHREILFEFDDEKSALDKENELVTLDLIKDKNCYNITGGGKGSWQHCKELIPVISENGEKIMATSSEMKERNLKGVNSLTVAVVDENGKQFRVSKNDPRYLSGELESFSKGKVSVKDKTGKTLSVSKNDPRYLSGELEYIFSGMVNVTDGEKTFKVKLNDPRYLSGELKTIGENLIVVKDKTGKTLSVSKNDPRYLSGEFIHVNIGKKRTLEQKQALSKLHSERRKKNKELGLELPRAWVNKDGKTTTILRSELNFYLQNGWKKGRI